MIDQVMAIANAKVILDGHRRYAGVELLERSGDPRRDHEALMSLDAVVLSHGGGADPHFVYANHAAADLWRIPVDELVGMPSRLSAAPEHRAERASMLGDALRDGVLRGYSGERIARDGTRFMIENAMLWTVDYSAGPGQAVVFRDWRVLESQE